MRQKGEVETARSKVSRLLAEGKQDVVFPMPNRALIKAPPELGQSHLDILFCFRCCFLGYRNRETDAFRSAHCLDCRVAFFSKPFHVFKQLVTIHIFVSFRELLSLHHATRLLFSTLQYKNIFVYFCSALGRMFGRD